MRTIAVINQKGGCGKTTTAINLGASLAFRGKQVLVVDMDPQAHATLGLGFTPGTYPNSVFDLLVSGDGRQVKPDDVIIPMADKLHLIPSDVILSAAEPALMEREGREYLLADVLGRLEGKYDFAIIDCPPNIGLLTFNALFACTEAIIPLETGLFALHGLSRLLETIEVVNGKRPVKIRANVLLTMFDRRTRIARETLDEVLVHMRDHVLSTVIGYNVRLKEAVGHGEPILIYDHTSTGARDYLDLAGELLRMKHVRQEAGKPVRQEVRRPVKQEERKPARPVKQGAEVEFSLNAPDAGKVFVVADFNEWKVGNAPMERTEGSGVWKLRMPLKKGSYEYKFHVDGRWITDPGNPNTRQNELGENSYLEVD